jgi:hypothetical protein
MRTTADEAARSAIDVYASVADARAEGIAVTEASDERLLALLDEATRLIDRVTGWFFEARDASLRLDGRGTPSLELPVPPIRLTRLVLNDSELSLLPRDLVIVGAPVHAGFDAPRLTLRHGRVFTRGQGNVVVEGRFGYTEGDGSAQGRTPLAIRRACLLLVLRNLAPLASDAATEARSAWRILEERTRDQSVRFSPVSSAVVLTGYPEVDELLVPYVRPSPFGAA